MKRAAPDGKFCMGEPNMQLASCTTDCRGAARLSAGRVLLACTLAVCVSLLVPVAAYAAGPDAIMAPVGFDANTIVRADDTANQVVGLPFTMNWNGTIYDQIYINMNGSCTFGTGYTGYNPNVTLSALRRNIMAPLWADVDTRNTSMGQVTYSNITPGSVPTVDGHDAFFVNWINVGRYNYVAAGNTQTDSFQLVIVDRSDTGAGNFDFMFNYDAVTWDIATASSSARARAGWGRSDGSAYELPGSGTPQASTSTLLDSSAAATSLIQNYQNDEGQLGRYVFEVRGATMPNSPPVIAVVNRTLEGNSPDSYLGYAGTGDATATDPDGTIVSLTHDRPAILPLGTTTVNWTATDNRGATTTRPQSIVVTDTVAPSLSTLTSPTHTVSAWSIFSSVAINSSVSTDVCSGLAGSSYSWSQDVPAVPDTSLEPSTITTTTMAVTTTGTVAVEDQEFANTTTWPGDWTRVLIADAGEPETFLRSQNTRANSGYAAELWTDANNSRRTFGFYKDFDLSAYDSAVLSYADYSVGLDNGTDYTRLEYSDDGGTSWTSLRSTSANTGWTQRSFPLQVGGPIRIRFSGSLNRTNEYCVWDDIAISAVRTTITTLYNTSSSVSTNTVLGDGTWYLNLRTVDEAGNWSSTSSFGPVRIDTTAPVTTDDAPTDWQNSDVSVTLTPTDAGQITSTTWKLAAGANNAYVAPILVSAEGTSTLLYWSADAAGHVETTKTAIIRIDKTAPSVPTTLSASALSTTSAQVSWPASTDAVSGVVRYDVYRDGVLVGAATATTYDDTGLTAGSTYAYTVRAVDAAGNASAQSGSASVLLPLSELWISVGSDSVLMPGIDPGIASTIMNATTISVGGLGTLGFDLTCSAPDFANADVGSPTPNFPISAMTFVTRGQVDVPARAFSNAPIVVDSSSGTLTEWRYDYILDFSVEVPWANEPGTYTTIVTYTLVPR